MCGGPEDLNNHFLCWSQAAWSRHQEQERDQSEMVSNCTSVPFGQLLRSSLVNNRTQAKVAEELGMQEYAITNDKTKRPVALRTKTLADLLECESYSRKLFEPANSKLKSKGPTFIFLFLIIIMF